jgi:hypothetical protein
MRLLLCFLLSCAMSQATDEVSQGFDDLDCPIYISSDGHSLVEQVSGQTDALYSQEQKLDELNLQLDQLIAAVQSEIQ